MNLNEDCRVNLPKVRYLNKKLNQSSKFLWFILLPHLFMNTETKFSSLSIYNSFLYQTLSNTKSLNWQTAIRFQIPEEETKLLLTTYKSKNAVSLQSLKCSLSRQTFSETILIDYRVTTWWGLNLIERKSSRIAESGFQYLRVCSFIVQSQ